MNKIKTAFKLFFKSRSDFKAAMVENLYFLFSDRRYLELQYKYHMGLKLDLDNPKRFTEKLQWLKLYNHDPKHTIMVDKIKAKDYVSSLIGEEYIIPTIAVYNDISQINWSNLPNQFVMKCTHDSSDIVICKDKSTFDKDAASKKLAKGLKKSLYRRTLEWPYKNVPRKIICEEYMVDESGYELKDYKWFCFDGVPKIMFVASDRQVKGEETKFDFFDMNFNRLPIKNGHPNSSKEIKRPASFETMKIIASKLSAGIPHARIDLYDINGRVYFGEITFFHYSGMVSFEPGEWDYKIGSWLNLPGRII